MITVDIYDDWLKQAKSRLDDCRREGVHLAELVIGHTLCEDDLYFLSIIDKCLRLIDGFTMMLEERNLTCAGILLRVQIDNCMRTYAAYLAENVHEVIDSIQGNGLQLNKIRSKDGCLMTDAYLRNQLSKFDKRSNTVYINASGYIHHSEKSFYQIASAKEPNTIELNIGNRLSDKLNPILAECTEAFIFFVNFQYYLTKPVGVSKERLDSQPDL